MSENTGCPKPCKLLLGISLYVLQTFAEGFVIDFSRGTQNA